MQYEYKFERIFTDFNFGGRTPERDYREVVLQHVEEGWEFVQAFAPSLHSHGYAPWFDLIFRRPKT